jgi:hypothetical protein
VLYRTEEIFRSTGTSRHFRNQRAYSNVTSYVNVLNKSSLSILKDATVLHGSTWLSMSEHCRTRLTRRAVQLSPIMAPDFEAARRTKASRGNVDLFTCSGTSGAAYGLGEQAQLLPTVIDAAPWSKRVLGDSTLKSAAIPNIQARSQGSAVRQAQSLTRLKGGRQRPGRRGAKSEPQRGTAASTSRC